MMKRAGSIVARLGKRSLEAIAGRRRSGQFGAGPHGAQRGFRSRAPARCAPRSRRRRPRAGDRTRVGGEPPAFTAKTAPARCCASAGFIKRNQLLNADDRVSGNLRPVQTPCSICRKYKYAAFVGDKRDACGLDPFHWSRPVAVPTTKPERSAEPSVNAPRRGRRRSEQLAPGKRAGPQSILFPPASPVGERVL